MQPSMSIDTIGAMTRPTTALEPHRLRAEHRCLDGDVAATYAEWFATLSDPTRVRLLHAVSTSPSGSLRVGDLAARLGISQSTCSHHVRQARRGRLRGRRQGRDRLGGVGQPRLLHRPPPRRGRGHGHAGHRALLSRGPARRRVDSGDDRRRTCPSCATSTPRASRPATRRSRPRSPAVAAARREVAARAPLGRRDSTERVVVGWTATNPVSSRDCYAGVGETSVYVTETARGRGVGKALLYRQVTEADAGGLWTLQTSVFPENRASHRAAPLRGLPHPRGSQPHRPAAHMQAFVPGAPARVRVSGPLRHPGADAVPASWTWPARTSAGRRVIVTIDSYVAGLAQGRGELAAALAIEQQRAGSGWVTVARTEQPVELQLLPATPRGLGTELGRGPRCDRAAVLARAHRAAGAGGQRARDRPRAARLVGHGVLARLRCRPVVRRGGPREGAESPMVGLPGRGEAAGVFRRGAAPRARRGWERRD